ncbi:hypothetical protein GJ744_001645 [Endocarpon pusillum]|uniref:Uncharacterized protein n=1 Tax=Endocarpon pusillum TaxID=364733 RepID=A0A8H7ACZ3_9EURO|nr:hypothetical protein GJ744_001645 [Endocarpon pusillum]
MRNTNNLIASRCETAGRGTTEASTYGSSNKNSKQTVANHAWPYGSKYPDMQIRRDCTESPRSQIQYRRIRVLAFTYMPFPTREEERKRGGEGANTHDR